MSAYCAISDVYQWIPRGSVPNPARLLGSVSASTEVMTLNNHGLGDDDEITFRADAGGTMPGGVIAAVAYYAIPLTDSTFSIAAAPGGAPVNITSAGSNVVLVVSVPWDAWIASCSAEIEQSLPAHVVPLDAPYPAIVVTYTAGLVAERALAWAGSGAPPGFLERMTRTRDDLKAWRGGKTIRGASVPSASNLAISATVAAADPRGWVPAGGNRMIP